MLEVKRMFGKTAEMSKLKSQVDKKWNWQRPCRCGSVREGEAERVTQELTEVILRPLDSHGQRNGVSGQV